VVRISDDEVLLDGRVGIDELNELFHSRIEAEDFDTVGGCVFHVLGRIPAVGDVVDVDRVKMTVLSVDGHRVRRVRAVRTAPLLPDLENGSSGGGNGQGNGRGKLNGKPEDGLA
jgi:CBS domain containing-hemolysin-like protein